MRCLAIGLALTGLSIAAPVRADPKGSDAKAAAEALFAEGQKLMAEGRFSEACSKFEASQRHDRGVGTMLNLADCYERLGRTARAWAEFRAAISAARAANRPDREELARERAQALESRLSRLTLSLSPEASAVPGFELRRNDARVDPAEFGASIPVDPGKHVVEASAPNHEKWVQTIEVAADATEVTVTIPPLAPSVEPGRRRDLVTPAGEAWPPQRTLAVAAGGVGVVGVALGTVFGLRAASKWKDAKPGCLDYPYGCSPRALDLTSEARSAGTLSTIGFVLGGVGLATGAVFWLTAPSGKEGATSVGVSPQGVIVKGSL